jgi:cytochrome b561
MSGEIAGPSVFSLELVGLIVGLSMIIGAVDLIRQPGWAWKRAQESKTAYLILVVLVPIVGLALYVFKGRPKVSSIAAAGRAASLPFERFGEEAAEHREDGLPTGAAT